MRLVWQMQLQGQVCHQEFEDQCKLLLLGALLRRGYLPLLEM